MKKKISFQYKFMRKYEVDFWGLLTSCSSGKRFFKKMFKILTSKHKDQIKMLNFFQKKPYVKFNYPRVMPMKQFHKWFSQDYIVRLHDLLKFRIYYGDMNIKKFRKYLQKVNTRRIDFESKILFLLESRLDMLLFRLNLVKTPKEGRQYVKCKKIKINDQIVNKLNYQLYLNDVISFDKKFSVMCSRTLWSRLKAKKVLFHYPKYLHVDYKLMKCIFISYPTKKTVPATWKMDLSFLKNFIG